MALIQANELLTQTKPLTSKMERLVSKTTIYANEATDLSSNQWCSQHTGEAITNGHLNTNEASDLLHAGDLLNTNEANDLRMTAVGPELLCPRGFNQPHMHYLIPSIRSLVERIDLLLLCHNKSTLPMVYVCLINLATCIDCQSRLLCAILRLQCYILCRI
jgi:hypothetical protein